MTNPDRPRFGCEEEVFIVDADTGAPANRPEAGFQKLRKLLGDGAQTEYKKSVLELVTQLKPTDPFNLANEVASNRFEADMVLREHGLRILPIAAHPLTPPLQMPASDGTRYREIEMVKGDSVRQLGVNGVHLHVGTYHEDAEQLAAMPWLLQLCPLHASATACSPWFEGRDTGQASWRLHVLVSLAPPLPMLPDTAAELEQLMTALRNADGPRDCSENWGLLRLGAGKPTIEFRAADTTPDLDALPGLAALSAAAAYTIRRGAMPEMRVGRRVEAFTFQANMMAASAKGICAKFIDPFDYEAKTVVEFTEAWVARCEAAISDLNYGTAVSELLGKLREMEHAGDSAARLREIMKNATRRAVWNGLMPSDAEKKAALMAIRWAWKIAENSPRMSLLARLKANNLELAH